MRRQNLDSQRLSAWEREVLRFLTDGKTTAEIARKLGLSLKSVQTYCARAKSKVGAGNFIQLLRGAFLLCNADMATRFDEWLNGLGSIEMRYFDLRGKLIVECTMPSRGTK